MRATSNDSMIKIYTALKMTGRMKDEIWADARLLIRTCDNYGFKALSPVVGEGIEDRHERLDLSSTDPILLEEYWHNDKALIRSADIVLDYNTMNQSDGVCKEIAYARYCLWMPVVRVWTGSGGFISRLEDDVVVPSLSKAMHVIAERWGTYEKLAEWRWKICGNLTKWKTIQNDRNARYNVAEVF